MRIMRQLVFNATFSLIYVLMSDKALELITMKRQNAVNQVKKSNRIYIFFFFITFSYTSTASNIFSFLEGDNWTNFHNTH